jgi:hypothetical protein
MASAESVARCTGGRYLAAEQSNQGQYLAVAKVMQRADDCSKSRLLEGPCLVSADQKEEV